MPSSRMTRRQALKRMAAAGLAVPFVFRAHAAAPARRSITPASAPRAWPAPTSARSTASKNLKLVAVADVDLSRSRGRQEAVPRRARSTRTGASCSTRKRTSNSVNVSTPDHMHAPIAMWAMQQGLHVYAPEAADADDLRGPAAHAESPARRSSSRRWAFRSTRTKSIARSWRRSRPARSAR